MKLSNIVSGATLAVGVGAFGLTEALSLRAGVEPLYAVARAIVAFMVVVCLARWSANALDALGPIDENDDPLGLGPERGDRSAGSGQSSR
jgi:hypothetical protein